MHLASGQRLGPYEIVGHLGAGGMGEVYRARDARLNRDVAIKVLPEVFASDPDRLARFAREAQTLAALNHPNIATIYGIEEADDVRALVMELVEGEDLSVVIGRGPMPIAEALPIARHIADALEAAHDQGIIHRDLKPANIKVRADGTVKVLDFGLAKALAPDAASMSADAAISPTLTARGTQMGTVIGTAAYMAPEQARGKAVDRRADIWAFGVVLYEMLTGRRAFDGDDISDVLASVLKSDPDWTSVPGSVPPSVRRLLRRCLEKDPRKRLSAIGDARFDLDEIEPVAAAPVPAAAVRPSLLSRLWPAIAGIALSAAVAALLWPREATSGAKVTRLSVLPPTGAELYPDSAQVVISPDARMVAFVVGTPAGGETQLWVRSFDSMTPRRLDAADGAALPFWSPDSRRIGFFAGKKLKTIAVAGGRADVVADAPFGRGAAWSQSNVIVFARDSGGQLYRVDAAGGDAVPVTTLDPQRKESAHRFPVFLPDGEHFLYAALPGRAGRFDIFAGSLRDNSRTLVGPMESAPVYADPGWLLFSRQGVLAAQRFDVNSRQLTGDVIPLEDEPTVLLDPSISWTAGQAVSVSKSGTVAYFSAMSQNTTATWLDVTGRILGTLNVPQGQYSGVRVSPDGTRAVLVRSMSRSDSMLWLVDVERGGGIPLSSGKGRNDSPVWSPDGTRVVFASDRDGPQDLYLKTIADAGPEQPFYRSPVLFKNPDSWSPDGRWIVLSQLDPETAHNLYLIPTSGTPALKPYVQGPMRQLLGEPSPDGRWLAYLSEESGRFEVYVQSFPEPGRKLAVSTEGASSCRWTSDGRALLFLDANRTRIWRVDVEPGDTLRVGVPKVIGTIPANTIAADVMPDGQRLLALVPDREGPGSVTVVQNWSAALLKNARD
jgi:Tol biopolymer transport system component